jgi:ribokinase
VSVDPGRRVTDRDFEPVVRRADAVFLNDREACALACDSDLDVDGAVIRTHGGEGAEVVADGERYAHTGFAAETVDTTGAGDAFAAGFIAARLDDADYGEALVVANACGALAAEVRGARAALSWAAVETVRARGPG